MYDIRPSSPISISPAPIAPKISVPVSQTTSGHQHRCCNNHLCPSRALKPSLQPLSICDPLVAPAICFVSSDIYSLNDAYILGRKGTPDFNWEFVACRPMRYYEAVRPFHASLSWHVFLSPLTLRLVVGGKGGVNTGRMFTFCLVDCSI